MNKSLALLTLLLGVLAVGSITHAQIGGEASVDLQVSPTDKSEPNPEAEADAAGSTDDDTGRDPSVVLEGPAISNESLGGASVSLSQEDAASASVDAAGAELGATSVATADDLSIFLTSALKRDANIENVSVSSDHVELTYNQDARFLAVIPASIDATAEVSADGEVNIDYPWYRFLFAVDGNADAEAELETRVRELLTGVSAEGGFSAALEAQLVAAIHAAFAGSAAASAGTVTTADMSGGPDASTDASAAGAADLSTEDDVSGSASGSGSTEGTADSE
ncbi:MAG TPA: hypothetical protein VGB97_02890 [Candidatus Paceibacterota bacterium]|jgi:hypothetical protein